MECVNYLNNKEYHINYKLSLFPSKFAGYQSKNKNKGEVKLYISSIWNAQFDPHDEFDINFHWFLEAFLYTMLLERICLERAFQKIRMTNRCVQYEKYRCKMDYITDLMLG